MFDHKDLDYYTHEGVSKAFDIILLFTFAFNVNVSRFTLRAREVVLDAGSGASPGTGISPL
jgi:hypothetical protein